MLPPTGWPPLKKRISKYLPKRDELLFLKVLALPKDSNNGLDCLFIQGEKKCYVIFPSNNDFNTTIIYIY